MRIHLRLFAFVFAAAAMLPLAGHAAPQIIGLVATHEPLPLSCVAGVCSVEVSGVCLQEHRQAPDTGTPYRVAKGSRLTLRVQGRDGVARTMAVEELVEVRSLRVFSSLLVSLPERLVRQLSNDSVRASLSVAPLASLIPVSVIGDKDPLSEEEIRTYTGSLRAVAERAIGEDKTNLGATRVLSHMVNRLRADTGSAEEIGTVGAFSMDVEPPPVAKLVTRAIDTCREKLRVEHTPHMRACLSNQHDILNSKITQNVWRSLRPGS